MLDATVMPVGNGPVREQEGKDKMHLLLLVFVVQDVQVCPLLPRKWCVRKLPCRGRRSHCKGEGITASDDALELPPHLILEVRLELRIHEVSRMAISPIAVCAQATAMQ